MFQEIRPFNYLNFGNRAFQTTADYLEQSGKLFCPKSQQGGGGSPVIRGFETVGNSTKFRWRKIK
jgi:hypothetical protein